VKKKKLLLENFRKKLKLYEKENSKLKKQKINSIWNISNKQKKQKNKNKAIQKSKK